jgi:undecaprenyl-diphosphatase
MEALPGEEALLAALRPLDEGAVHEFMVLIRSGSDLLPLASLAVVVLLWLAGTGRFRDAPYFLAAVGGVWALNPLLKVLFARPRPDLSRSYEEVSSYGFPSGHAANTAALVGGILLVLPGRRRRLAAALVGVVLLAGVGFSQLVLGVHYPSDIVAGWAWAVIWVGAVAATRTSRGNPPKFARAR